MTEGDQSKGGHCENIQVTPIAARHSHLHSPTFAFLCHDLRFIDANPERRKVRPDILRRASGVDASHEVLGDFAMVY